MQTINTTTEPGGGSGPLSFFTGDSTSASDASQISGAIRMKTGDDAGDGSTGNVSLETGDITDPGNTNDTGNINLVTGSNAGSGVRGKVKLDALMATLPIGTADPSGVGEQTGDCYYKTDTKELRVYDGAGWVGVTLS